MGEAKQEEGKGAAEAKAEENKTEEKKEEEVKKEEEKKEEKEEEKKEEEIKPPSPPPPPPPVVLFVDLHCVGCAKKIERCLLKCKGVEEVETDMSKNQVKIKGMVDPQGLCTRIEKKTMRNAKVISPPPPSPDTAAPDSLPPLPQVVASQVDGVTTVELHVNMHCEACAQQLRKKILKMRGVQSAETELSSGTVKVTGTVSGDKIVEYIYRRTGKLAKVIPPPPPPPPKEEGEKKEAEDQKPSDEKKEDDNKANQEKKGEENAEKKDDEKAAPEGEGEKKEGSKEGAEKEVETGPTMQYVGPDDMGMKRIMYWNGGGGGNYYYTREEELAKRMMMPAVYVIERPPPPPQLFSDENPNACCIS